MPSSFNISEIFFALNPDAYISNIRIYVLPDLDIVPSESRKVFYDDGIYHARLGVV